MAKAKNDNKIGKFFEDKKMTPALQELAKTHGVFFHKLKDTYSAGAYMPASPADYLVACKGRVQLLECKASVVHFSLKSCLSMVSDNQVGSHQLWHRSGNESRFIFYSDQTALVEFWDGKEVVECKVSGASLKSQPIAVCRVEGMGQALLDLFYK